MALQADELFDAGEIVRSLDVVRQQLERVPDDYGAQWRAARASVAIGLLVDEYPEERNRWMERAAEYGEEAVSRQPLGLDGLFWRAAAKGRLALHQGPFRTVSLAKQVHQEAGRILALDSLNAGAHNILGRLNLEVMILPGWKRAIARRLAGSLLQDVSWDLARTHLSQAAKLEPQRVLYQRDLGALYLHTGEVPQARMALERALSLPSALPGDELFKEEARQMLEQLAVAAQESEQGGRR